MAAHHVQHRRAGIDPAHGDAASAPATASGIASRPVPTPSSSTGPLPGQLEQRGDGQVDVGQTAVPVVVHVGEPIAVRGWSVSLHRRCTVPDGRIGMIGSVGACSSPTYLDHAATSPMRAQAIEAMLPFLDERFANPSGSHRFARDARRAVDEARDRVAGRARCAAGRGRVHRLRHRERQRRDRRSARQWRHRGVHGGRAPRRAPRRSSISAAASCGVDGCGRVDLDDLAKALGPDVAIVSVMAVNNEVGTITDLAAVSEARPRACSAGAVAHRRRAGRVLARSAGDHARSST